MEWIGWLITAIALLSATRMCCCIRYCSCAYYIRNRDEKYLLDDWEQVAGTWDVIDDEYSSGLPTNYLTTSDDNAMIILQPFVADDKGCCFVAPLMFTTNLHDTLYTSEFSFRMIFNYVSSSDYSYIKFEVKQIASVWRARVNAYHYSGTKYLVDYRYEKLGLDTAYSFQINPNELQLCISKDLIVIGKGIGSSGTSITPSIVWFNDDRKVSGKFGLATESLSGQTIYFGYGKSPGVSGTGGCSTVAGPCWNTGVFASENFSSNYAHNTLEHSDCATSASYDIACYNDLGEMPTTVEISVDNPFATVTPTVTMLNAIATDPAAANAFFDVEGNTYIATRITRSERIADRSLIPTAIDQTFSTALGASAKILRRQGYLFASGQYESFCSYKYQLEDVTVASFFWICKYVSGSFVNVQKIDHSFTYERKLEAEVYPTSSTASGIPTSIVTPWNLPCVSSPQFPVTVKYSISPSDASGPGSFVEYSTGKWRYEYTINQVDPVFSGAVLVTKGTPKIEVFVHATKVKVKVYSNGFYGDPWIGGGIYFYPTIVTTDAASGYTNEYPTITPDIGDPTGTLVYEWTNIAPRIYDSPDPFKFNAIWETKLLDKTLSNLVCSGTISDTNASVTI